MKSFIAFLGLFLSLHQASSSCHFFYQVQNLPKEEFHIEDLPGFEKSAYSMNKEFFNQLEDFFPVNDQSLQAKYPGLYEETKQLILDYFPDADLLMYFHVVKGKKAYHSQFYSFFLNARNYIARRLKKIVNKYDPSPQVKEIYYSISKILECHGNCMRYFAEEMVKYKNVVLDPHDSPSRNEIEKKNASMYGFLAELFVALRVPNLVWHSFKPKDVYGLSEDHFAAIIPSLEQRQIFYKTLRVQPNHILDKEFDVLYEKDGQIVFLEVKNFWIRNIESTGYLVSKSAKQARKANDVFNALNFEVGKEIVIFSNTKILEKQVQELKKAGFQVMTNLATPQHTSIEAIPIFENLNEEKKGDL